MGRVLARLPSWVATAGGSSAAALRHELRDASTWVRAGRAAFHCRTKLAGAEFPGRSFPTSSITLSRTLSNASSSSMVASCRSPLAASVPTEPKVLKDATDSAAEAESGDERRSNPSFRLFARPLVHSARRVSCWRSASCSGLGVPSTLCSTSCTGLGVPSTLCSSCCSGCVAAPAGGSARCSGSAAAAAASAGSAAAAPGEASAELLMAPAPAGVAVISSRA
mmetsp:Transcript_21433/g.59456  ORF Transcript_21433/g.59456 Transcript_21433/m.59456 type:complete len:223 (+) Transcript_21433:303-971(+)